MKYLNFFLKILFPVSSLKIMGPQTDALEFLKKDIRTEIYSASLKILLGFIVAVVITFSTIQFLLTFQILFSENQNVHTYKLLGFGCIIFFGFIALYFLFKQNTKKNILIIDQPISTVADIQNLSANFTSGFIKGFTTYKQ